MEASLGASVVAWLWFSVGDYRRHRRASVFLRLIIHEARLFTSFLRWLGRRGPQGVEEGDIVARYASGQAFVVAAFLFASIVETIALALVVPWPVIRQVVLVIDLWGVYFVIAMQASCVVRPHILRADGSPLLRYGVPGWCASTRMIRRRSSTVKTTPNRMLVLTQPKTAGRCSEPNGPDQSKASSHGATRAGARSEAGTVLIRTGSDL